MRYNAYQESSKLVCLLSSKNSNCKWIAHWCTTSMWQQTMLSLNNKVVTEKVAAFEFQVNVSMVLVERVDLLCCTNSWNTCHWRISRENLKSTFGKQKSDFGLNCQKDDSAARPSFQFACLLFFVGNRTQILKFRAICFFAFPIFDPSGALLCSA